MLSSIHVEGYKCFFSSSCELLFLLYHENYNIRVKICVISISDMDTVGKYKSPWNIAVCNLQVW